MKSIREMLPFHVYIRLQSFIYLLGKNPTNPSISPLHHQLYWIIPICILTRAIISSNLKRVSWLCFPCQLFVTLCSKTLKCSLEYSPCPDSLLNSSQSGLHSHCVTKTTLLRSQVHCVLLCQLCIFLLLDLSQHLIELLTPTSLIHFLHWASRRPSSLGFPISHGRSSSSFQTLMMVFLFSIHIPVHSHPYADNSKIYTSSPDLVPELLCKYLLNVSTWKSNKHVKPTSKRTF